MGKRIQYEDDLVKVYVGDKEVYSGLEDYEPMKREMWLWDDANGEYTLDVDGVKLRKVCFG